MSKLYLETNRNMQVMLMMLRSKIEGSSCQKEQNSWGWEIKVKRNLQTGLQIVGLSLGRGKLNLGG